MKKSILLVAAIALGTVASAQELNVGVNVGYGFGLPGNTLGQSTDADYVTGPQTITNFDGSIGSGFNAGLNLGYMFNENVGVDLGLDYLMGANVLMSETRTVIPTQTVTTSQYAQTSQFRISPSVVISSGGDGLQVYGRAGLVLPVFGNTIATAENDQAGAELDYAEERKGAFALGYQGALGVSFPMGDKISLYGELNGVNLRIKSKSSKVTRNNSGSTDNLPFMTESQINTNFVSELNSSSNSYETNSAGYNTNAADEQLTSTTDFSALFIKVGVKFRF